MPYNFSDWNLSYDEFDNELADKRCTLWGSSDWKVQPPERDVAFMLVSR